MRISILTLLGSLLLATSASGGGDLHRVGSLRYGDFKGRTVTMCGNGGGACQVRTSNARCPSGSIASGGGWDGGNHPSLNATAGYNEPDPDGRGWSVILVNHDRHAATFHAVVVCIA